MQIAEALSSQRLAAYRRSPQESEQQVLRRYLWNVALSEALYPSLHVLEVVLRNHAHAVIAAGLSDPQWLVKARALEPREAGLVRAAIESLIKQQKEPNEGNIIAALNFGFWTSVFDAPYERIFWQKNIKHAFPHIQRRQRTRHVIAVRLNHVRKLRNRVFHYEPIWHWQDLAEQHAAVVETISWMSPSAASLIQSLDRFSAVISAAP